MAMQAMEIRVQNEQAFEAGLHNRKAKMIDVEQRRNLRALTHKQMKKEK